MGVPVSPFCPHYHHAVEVLGRRWTGAIVRALLAGATRFSEITAAVPGLSDRLCSERLKELEAEGIVARHVLADTPVRIEYRLTAKGAALADVVTAIGRWATTWAPCEPPPDEDPDRSAVAEPVRRG
jgi:DNA-binding HxlR family transcriptional regulator